ncbi:hypothetical protein VOLCADRAFT_98742 [Volvox carteri f. nagariensis]|uniref:Uncharacterized protein n=1 Tax=Volvox carteri f. nagariensis TaxID=3068 RepID=D8UG63_VOLCA|nr:uncharacterized protein VOLCADRAFT_98742 [Volvox carteri f. nagariensis]EFJ41322.1 hypothetical protein VOLCADRAFT_98742 [Volvox carteri f. nagariensis]|eukprot:XP_002957656.1 hypothetical protein VOLCADRAFT_98742 [Volvox carteri f. nagariensis]
MKHRHAATSNNHLLNVVKIVSHLEKELPLQRTHTLPLQSSPHRAPGEQMRSGRDVEGGELEAEAAELLLLLPAAPPPDALRECVLRCEVLVGPEYYAAKQAMLDAEQRLLRALQFRVAVPQPHALLLNAARCVRMPGGVQRLALAMLNDLWAYTDFCLLSLLPAEAAPGPAPVEDAGGRRGIMEEGVLAVVEAAARLSGWVVRVPSHARDAGLHWWQLLGAALDETGMAVWVTAVVEACTACHAAREAAERGLSADFRRGDGWIVAGDYKEAVRLTDEGTGETGRISAQ